MAKRQWMIVTCILAVVFLLAYTSYAYYTISIPLLDSILPISQATDTTHDKLTRTALAKAKPTSLVLEPLWIDPSQYPDLAKFNSTIRMVGEIGGNSLPLTTMYPDHWVCKVGVIPIGAIPTLGCYYPAQVEDAHYSPDNKKLYWKGNEAEWEKKMLGD